MALSRNTTDRRCVKGAKREAFKRAADSWLIVVTPPAWSGFSANHIVLTESQYHRYQKWLAVGGLLKQYLPELDADQREILLSGIGKAEWDEAFGKRA